MNMDGVQYARMRWEEHLKAQEKLVALLAVAEAAQAWADEDGDTAARLLELRAALERLAEVERRLN